MHERLIRRILLDPGHQDDAAGLTAIERATSLASSLGAEVFVVLAVPRATLRQHVFDADDPELPALLSRAKRPGLEPLLRAERDRGRKISLLLTPSDDLEHVTQLAHGGFDLLVVPVRPDDLMRTALRGPGPLQRLLRATCCPVLALHEAAPAGFRRVLAALAPSEGTVSDASLNQAIAAFATSVAHAEGAELHVVQALPRWDDDLAPFTRHWTPSEIRAAEAIRQEQVAEALRVLVSPAGAGSARIHVRFGEPEPCIHAVVRTIGADLLVIGTCARKGLMAAFIGNTAEKLLGQIETSMLVVPPGPR